MRVTATRGTVYLIVTSCILGQASVANAHGRFLFEDNSPTLDYGGVGGAGNPVEFDDTVTDTTKSINAGMIRFDYDTYYTPGQGGAGLSGGFFMNEGVTLKPGFSLGWVQTVTADHTGGRRGTEWNLPRQNAGEYPDGTPTNPRYPFTAPSRSPDGMTPTFGFRDYPNRLVADGNQSWLAELGLTCISDTANLDMDGMAFREVRVIDTFLWGFNLHGLPAPAPGIGNVGSDPPAFWSDPTQSYLDALNEFYDGSGGGGRPAGTGVQPPVASAKYHFTNNDNCFREAPETDFNGDGTPGIDDIDTLTQALASGTQDPLFDLTGDGVLDHDDVIDWLKVAGYQNLGAPYLIGDSNLDGYVDGQDFVAWNNHKFSDGGLWSIGDLNVDGVVDGVDFVAWNEWKFQSSFSDEPGGNIFDGFAVPEPGSNMMILAAALAPLALRRRAD